MGPGSSAPWGATDPPRRVLPPVRHGCAQPQTLRSTSTSAQQRPRVPMRPAPAPAQQDGDAGASSLLASTLRAPRHLEPTVLRGHGEAPRRGAQSPRPPQALQTPQART